MDSQKNTQRRLTLGSLFDGSGGFPLGSIISGMVPVWASEIEPFAVRVTTKRLPFMKHYGDVAALDGGKLEPVDVITFGSPCQDMSIAGKRTGLDGSRSNLFYEAIRIVKEMRCATDGRYPRYIVWENVPGAFSSKEGADFQAVLESICAVKGIAVSAARPEKWPGAGEILADGFSLAWRVQHWGVPQRRKRIYLVADFDGGSAGKVLFESEGMSGYSPQGFRSWEAAPGNAGESSAAAGGLLLNNQKDAVSAAILFENHSQDTRYTGPTETAQTVSATYGSGGNNQPFVLETPKTLKIRSGCEGGGKGALIQNDKSATLSCANDQTLFQPTAYGVCSKASHSMLSDNPRSGFYKAETSRTLDSGGGSPTCNQGGICVVEPLGFDRYNGAVTGGVSQMMNACAGASGDNTPIVLEGNGARPSHLGDGYSESETMYTLNATEHHAVAHPAYCATMCNFLTVSEEKTQALLARDYKDPPCVSADPYYIVRRLTPVECARLQGFPDWWCKGLETENPAREDIDHWREVWETHRKVMGTSSKPKTDKQIIKWLKEPYSDSAEYRLWGNGVALPCVCFVLAGIVWAAGLDMEKGAT